MVPKPDTQEAAPAAADPPEGIFGIFLTGSTQEKFGIVSGQDVTDEKPQAMLKKEEILNHIKVNGVISDFHCSQALVSKYPEDEIMIVMDEENVFGQNFYLCTTLEAKEWELSRAAAATAEADAEAAAEAGEAEDAPPKELEPPRPWESLGSEEEVDALTIKPRRPLIVQRMSRKRTDFGKPCRFNDDSGMYEEFRPYRDKHFELSRSEAELGVQAVPAQGTVGVQTRWFRKQNFTVQYQPLTATDVNLKEEEVFASAADTAEGVRSSMDAALRQNETFDVFADDLASLYEEESSLGSGLDSAVKEFQSFTDIQFSKNKCVSCIDWQPGGKGIVAVSCTERLSFEERVEVDGKVPVAHILVWNFSDPIHPQLVLDAPGDCFSFRFNPSNPNIIAAGGINGLVMYWDTTQAMEEAKSRERHSQNREDGDDDTGAPVIKPTQMSLIELTHKRSVTDLVWLPPDSEVVARGGRRVAKEGTECFQFATVAADGLILFWDTRVMREDKSGASFWAPLFKVSMNSVEGSGELGGCQLLIRPSAEGSNFAVTTEDGELVFADWCVREAAGEDGAGGTTPARSWSSAHCAPCTSLQQSPFLDDVILTVGDWTFNIFKLGVKEPVFTSTHSVCRLTMGRWSTTRPAVVVTAKSDGSIDIWDLLDRSHEPSMTVNVSSSAVWSVEFWEPKRKMNQQLLGAGDANGTLHVLEMPGNLRRPVPNEMANFASLLSREVHRVSYIRSRLGVREKELMKERQLEEEREKAAEEQRAAAEAAAAAAAAAAEEAVVSGAAPVAAVEQVTVDPEVVKINQDYAVLAKELRKKLGLATEEDAAKPAK